jgi:hypothetical protein
MVKRSDYYFKSRNAAREFRLRIKRWKAEQKYPADTSSFDDSVLRARFTIVLPTPCGFALRV